MGDTMGRVAALLALLILLLPPAVAPSGAGALTDEIWGWEDGGSGSSGGATEPRCSPACTAEQVCTPGSKTDQCVHKDLRPVVTGDWLACVALFFGLSLASAGGVGGGALVVPILILLDGWGAAATVPFAQLCGFVTAVPRFAMTVTKRHPHDPRRPLIDFESFLVLTPAALIGNLIGVHLNVTAPPPLLLLIMIILLTYITIRTCRRGLTMWRAQRQAAQAASKPLLDTASSAADGQQDELAGDAGGVNGWCAGAAMLLLFLAVSTLAFVRGSASRPSRWGIPLCSLDYWLLDAAALTALVAFLGISGSVAIARHRRRSESALAYLPGDVAWELRGVLKYGGCAMVAGCASSFIGIGGGIVIVRPSRAANPRRGFAPAVESGGCGQGFLLHEMQLLPQVASATVTLITLFTCGSNVAQYTMLRRLPLDYGL